jgi:hypothetical protein
MTIGSFIKERIYINPKDIVVSHQVKQLLLLRRVASANSARQCHPFVFAPNPVLIECH